MNLKRTLGRLRPLHSEAMAEAEKRQGRLTKPPGALGALEGLAVRLAGMTGQPRPRFTRRVIVVAAASHGVTTDEWVSAYPPSVTAQMVANFIAGGAAINVLADQAGAELLLVDAGVEPEPPPHPRLRRAGPDPSLDPGLGRGSANFLKGPALARAEAEAVVCQGIALVEELAGEEETLLLGLGEMGIGNTTASAAIVAALTRASVRDVTGRGTQIDDARLRHKRQVIEQALLLHQPRPADPLGVLSAVGGYEIGFLAGCCLGAAARRYPVVLDGYVTAAAALIAHGLAPQVRDYLIAGHRSTEPGHRIALEFLDLEPLLDLGLRLGEGSGAALALPIVLAAARTLDEMATFDEAGVDEQEP